MLLKYTAPSENIHHRLHRGRADADDVCLRYWLHDRLRVLATHTGLFIYLANKNCRPQWAILNGSFGGYLGISNSMIYLLTFLPPRATEPARRVSFRRRRYLLGPFVAQMMYLLDEWLCMSTFFRLICTLSKSSHCVRFDFFVRFSHSDMIELVGTCCVYTDVYFFEALFHQECCSPPFRRNIHYHVNQCRG